jgi:hypothetical protein
MKSRALARRLAAVLPLLAAFVIGLLAAFISVPPGRATQVNTFDVQFPPPAKVPFPRQAFGDIAFTRDGAVAVVKGKAKAVGEVVFTSLTYPTNLKDGQRFEAFDSLFGICYGGGYVAPLVGASAAGVAPSRYTIAASTGWFQLARNDSNVDIPGPQNKLRNFLNTWREDVRLLPGGGMLSHFDFAALLSPFMPPEPGGLVPGFINYAIYASPDEKGATTNDSRPLGDENLGQPNQARQFAILAQWDRPARRHTINILRFYDVLTRELGVPANRIAILFNNPAPAAIGPFPGPFNDDPDGLLPPNAPGGKQRQAPVNGPNTEELWKKAIGGELFLDANGKPIEARVGDKVFIMHTGHGGMRSAFKGLQTSKGNTTEYDVVLDGKYSLFVSGNLDLDTSMADVGDDGVTLEQNLQFSFASALPAGTTLTVNGNDVGPMDQFLVSPGDALPIRPFIIQSTVSYRLTLPQHFFTDVNRILLRFTSPGSIPDPALASLLAFDISGGDQELLVQLATEPDLLVTTGNVVQAGAVATVEVRLRNTGGTHASSVRISAVAPVTPTTYVGPALPVSVGTIAAGTTVSTTIQLNIGDLSSGAIARFQISGGFLNNIGNNFQFGSVRGVKLK